MLQKLIEQEQILTLKQHISGCIDWISILMDIPNCETICVTMVCLTLKNFKKKLTEEEKIVIHTLKTALVKTQCMVEFRF